VASAPVEVERRFHGPPESAQGGYACGLVAERIAGSSASVSLRLAPPLERPLDVHEGPEGSVLLMDGDRVIAEGAPADLALDPPPPVAPQSARAAWAASPWTARHPFPTCFGCGPERSQDEAVAITMGRVDGGETFAATWTPLAEFAAADGAVTTRFAWAALDCPTAAPAFPASGAPCVLGRLTARLIAPIEAGREHVVMAWPIGHDGRKHRGGAAIYASGGELCAYSEGLWIELKDPSSAGART
jgi:hypothetical protein